MHIHSVFVDEQILSRDVIQILLHKNASQQSISSQTGKF